MISDQNLKFLKSALHELNAGTIFVPTLSQEVLMKGHTCHFRSYNKDIKWLRMDIINIMRIIRKRYGSFYDMKKTKKEKRTKGIGIPKTQNPRSIRSISYR